MPKDFTDYIMLVMGRKSLESIDKKLANRVWGVRHLSAKGKDAGYRVYRHNGHLYAIERSKAFWNANLLPWTPWFEWKKGQFRKSFKEWVRPKKVGIMLCVEPDEGVVETIPIQPLTFSDLTKAKMQLGHNTPHTLKAVLEDRSYLKSLSSLPFAKKVMGKYWFVIVIGAVLALVVILLMSGVIPMG